MVQTKIKTITKEELKKKIDSKENIQIVNVLETEGYRLGVIKGSKKIPLSELDQRFNELDRSKEIITYCANRQCSASRQAAEKLASKGFNVKAYEGGAMEWTQAGLPLEKLKQ